jgi:deoxyhypusine synthase
MSTNEPLGGAPSTATDAVLKPSQPVPKDSRVVHGVEFNKYSERDGGIKVEELVGGMAGMGFQASAVAEAARIVEEMVCGSVMNQRDLYHLSPNLP